MNYVRHAEIHPFLLRYAVSRSKTEELPGYYDRSREVWVVDTEFGPQAIVETAHNLIELVTKTKVRQEQDDEAWARFAATSTSGASTSIPCLFELATKTDVVRERDDR